MNVRLRTAAVLVSAVLLAACGGGDSDGSAKRDAKPDPRKGYFDKGESQLLNPTFATYDTAYNAYYDNAPACQKKSDKLAKAGKPERVIAACFIKANENYHAAVTGIRDALGEVEGEFRTQCDTQIDDFDAYLEKFEAALQAERANWDLYVARKPYPKLQPSVNVIQKLAGRFPDEVRALTLPCYTKADRAEADAAAAKAEKDATTDAKGEADTAAKDDAKDA